MFQKASELIPENSQQLTFELLNENAAIEIHTGYLPRVARFLAEEPCSTVQATTERIVKKVANMNENESSHHFIVRKIADQSFVGCVDLYREEAYPGVRLYLWVTEQNWGNQYGREILDSIWLFVSTHYPLSRLRLKVPRPEPYLSQIFSSYFMVQRGEYVLPEKRPFGRFEKCHEYLGPAPKIRRAA